MVAVDFAQAEKHQRWMHRSVMERTLGSAASSAHGEDVAPSVAQTVKGGDDAALSVAQSVKGGDDAALSDAQSVKGATAFGSASSSVKGSHHQDLLDEEVDGASVSGALSLKESSSSRIEHLQLVPEHARQNYHREVVR